MKNRITQTIFITALVAAMISSVQSLKGQTQVYDPKGDPKKWHVELTPFLWLPWVSGNIETDYVSQNFDVPAVDLLKNLKMAFMMTAEVSKGKFFASPTYIYTKLASEKVLRTDKEGQSDLVSVPVIKMNILEFIAGLNFSLHHKWMLDPYIGFRYNNFLESVQVESPLDTTYVSETIEFWDPVIGFQAEYYPHPRVPLILKADIGGFGAGSKLSWSTTFDCGYSVSPVIDLLAGFTAYGFDYESTVKDGKMAAMTTILYGFDLGIRVNLPKRYKDPAIYKHAKKAE